VDSWGGRLYFLQAQHEFSVKHYPTCSYLACQIDFVCELFKSPVADMLTIFNLIKYFHDTGSINDKKHSGCPSVLSVKSLENIHVSLL
jgi:hypothetical protein